MISRTFLKSSFIYTIVGALPYAAGFLLLPWFTKYLTPEQFGVNALYISMMYLIQIFASFGLDLSIGVIYFDFKDRREQLREALGTAFIGLLIVGAFVFVFFSLGGFRLFTLIFRSGNYMELMPFGLITVVSAIFNSVFKTYSALLVYEQRPVKFFWLNITNFLVNIGASLLILYLYPFTLYGPIVGRLIPAVLTASVAALALSKEVGLSWNSAYVRKILQVSAPLLIYGILTWIVSYIDRFIILGMLHDPALVAIYDVAVKMVLFIDLIMTGLVSTVNPKVFSIWKEQDLHGSTPEVNRYYNGLTAFFLLVIPLFVLVAPLLIPLFIHNPVYYQAFPYLPLLSAGFATRVWFFMFLAPILFFKKTKVLPRVLLLSALFEIGGGILLVHFFGLQGIVWTYFLVKPFQALFMYLASRRIYEFRVNRTKIFLLPIAFMALVILSELFVREGTRLITGSAVVLASALLVWFAYRREAMPILRKLWGS